MVKSQNPEGVAIALKLTTVSRLSEARGSKKSWLIKENFFGGYEGLTHLVVHRKGSTSSRRKRWISHELFLGDDIWGLHASGVKASRERGAVTLRNYISIWNNDDNHRHTTTRRTRLASVDLWLPLSSLLVAVVAYDDWGVLWLHPWQTRYWFQSLPMIPVS